MLISHKCQGLAQSPAMHLAHRLRSDYGTEVLSARNSCFVVLEAASSLALARASGGLLVFRDRAPNGDAMFTRQHKGSQAWRHIYFFCRDADMHRIPSFRSARKHGFELRVSSWRLGRLFSLHARRPRGWRHRDLKWVVAKARRPQPGNCWLGVGSAFGSHRSEIRSAGGSIKPVGGPAQIQL